MDIGQIAQGLAVWAIPVLLAITLHEAAHGYAAWRLGDDTAYRLGRVTLNPLQHVDLLGTVLIPGFLLLAGAPILFGYAKPVPVRFDRLRRPRRDMILVAAAGPGANIVLAIAAAALFHAVPILPEAVSGLVQANLLHMLELNLVLAAFNMLPIPPLDGGRVAVGLLPRVLAIRLARLERWGMLIIIGVAFLLPTLAANLGMRFNPLSAILRPVIDVLAWLIIHLVGLKGVA